MVHTAVYFGANEKNARDELSKVLDFEMKLAKISTDRIDRRNETILFNPTTIEQLPMERGMPKSWLSFIQTYLNHPNVKINVGKKEVIIIRDIGFVRNIGQVIASTPNQVLANYVGWRVVMESMKHLNSEARNLRHEFHQSISGVQSQKPLWKTCVHETGFNSYYKYSFIFAASSMYAKRYFKPEDKNQMIEMTNYLREAFSEIIVNLDWMDEKTKVNEF